jgi:hypothetical protein
MHLSETQVSGAATLLDHPQYKTHSLDRAKISKAQTLLWIQQEIQRFPPITHHRLQHCNSQRQQCNTLLSHHTPSSSVLLDQNPFPFNCLESPHQRKNQAVLQHSISLSTFLPRSLCTLTPSYHLQNNTKHFDTSCTQHSGP